MAQIAGHGKALSESEIVHEKPGLLSTLILCQHLFGTNQQTAGWEIPEKGLISCECVPVFLMWWPTLRDQPTG